MQRTSLALSRFSAVAASILVASAIPAAGEPDVHGWDDPYIELSATGSILAALDPAPSIPVQSAPLDIAAPASTAAFAAPDAALVFAPADSKATPAAPFALAAIDPQAFLSEPTIKRPIPEIDNRIVLSADDAIVGIASFYDDPQQTASGEQYDPNAYTAAAQLEIRHRFGGVRYGRLYQAAYGLGEYRGKKIIVRFNDVGPLRPGRKFDLSRAAMAYYDSTLEKGLLPNFKMTPLPLGRTYPKGPITDEQLAALGIDDGATMDVCDVILDDTAPIYTASIPKPKAAPVAQTEQPKAPPMVAKPMVAKPVVAKSVVAKPATTRVAAKPARPATKAVAARAAAKTAAAARANVKVATPAPAPAPQAAEQSPTVTPWVKRVWSWVTSGSADQTTQPPQGKGPAPEKHAQAR